MAPKQRLGRRLLNFVFGRYFDRVVSFVVGIQ
jgi:hypothetical protein